MPQYYYTPTGSIKGNETSKEIRAFIKRMEAHFWLDFTKIPGASGTRLKANSISREQLKYDPERQNAIFGFALAEGSTAYLWHQKYTTENPPPADEVTLPMIWGGAGPLASLAAFEAAHPSLTYYKDMTDAFLARFVAPNEHEMVIEELAALTQGNKSFKTLLDKYENLQLRLPTQRDAQHQRDDLVGKKG